MTHTKWIADRSSQAALAAVVLVLLGVLIGRQWGRADSDEAHVSSTTADGQPTIWTCSMHPQIRQPEPGDCPICGMDLIPASDGAGDELGPRMMSMSEESRRLAEVQTTPVVRKFVDVQIPLVGKVDYDETRLKTIAAWVPGRLDRLFVDYTGVPVREGDHLVEIYSPELYATQEELLQAIRAVKRLEGSSSEIVRRSTERTVESTREKLRLLGLSREQIAEVEQRGTASATVQINAPVSGIVIHKNANEGAYVQTGTPIYTLADLSMVWVMLDAYESDIAWLRYGQEVEILTEAYGNRTFPGWISFIDPVLNPQTRTVKVRVAVENPDGLLRPNMYARAIVKARVAAGDQVISSNLEGKWVSPMHPEIVKDEPGECDVCGMPLVEADRLGYVTEAEAEPPLVVPASAVLTTGERAIVYVRVPDAEKPTFQGVEVTTGPRAGDSFIIRSGLKEGQQVVTNGNFKIDSALQLQAKPSMMNPEGGGPAPTGHAGHGDMAGATPATSAASSASAANDEQGKPQRLDVPMAFLEQLTPLYQAYFDAQEALAADDETKARAALDRLAEAVSKVDMTLVQGQAHMQWMELSRQLTAALEHRAHRPGMPGARKVFLDVSNVMIALEQSFGHTGDKPHRLAYCPMANDDQGASWLQLGEVVNNPYYGAAMLKCGEIRETLPAAAPAEGDGHGQHE